MVTRRARMMQFGRRRRGAAADFTAALANDLNTAEAAAAISEMVRAANSAADAGTLGQENADEILRVLNLFDGVFAVLVDRDAELTRAALRLGRGGRARRRRLPRGTGRADGAERRADHRVGGGENRG